MRRIAIAQDTLKILSAGYYLSPNGKKLNLEPELQSSLALTKYYEPDTLSQIETEVLSLTAQFSKTDFEVRNETTLMGAQRMAQSSQFLKIGVLNFASAKNPGGGFLKGAQSQEESLARSSALYKSLLKCPEYYNFHRGYISLLYSDRMIYSPGCPVFKTDNGTLLEQPYFVDFITSPAPNAGAIQRKQPDNWDKISEVLYNRGAKVLSLAVYNGCDALVLGAWGCGVFQNQPSMVAQMFANLLLPNGQFFGRFKSVLFSVFDLSTQTETFRELSERFSSAY